MLFYVLLCFVSMCFYYLFSKLCKVESCVYTIKDILINLHQQRKQDFDSIDNMQRKIYVDTDALRRCLKDLQDLCNQKRVPVKRQKKEVSNEKANSMAKTNSETSNK